MSFSKDIQESRARKIKWIGDSKEVLSAFPPDVKDCLGQHLWLNQMGQHSSQTKPFKAEIPKGVKRTANKNSIYEIWYNGEIRAYRLIYAAFPDAIYVLHTFSKSGSTETPHADVNAIAAGLKAAKQASEESRGVGVSRDRTRG